MRLNAADAEIWDDNLLAWENVGGVVEAPVPGTNSVYRLMRTPGSADDDPSYDLYLDSPGGSAELMCRGSRAWAAAGVAGMHYIRSNPAYDDDEALPGSGHCMKETMLSLVPGLVFRDPVDPELLRSTFQPSALRPRFV